MSDASESHNRNVWTTWKSKEDNFQACKPIRSMLIYGEYPKELPSVSVIIPAYKKLKGLKAALDSAVSQDYDLPYEVIVADDSGFDVEIDSLMNEYCHKYPNILYYRNEKNLGVFGNMNRTCELCRSEWYCLLHDDDRMKPGYLKTCMSAVNSLPANVGMIGIYYEAIDSNTNEVKRTYIDRLVDLFVRFRNNKPIYMSLRDNIKHIFIQPCCSFINRDKFVELGGFNGAFMPSGDFVLAAKMNHYYSTVFLPVILAYRGVGTNVSLNQSNCNGSIIAAYNLSFELAKELGLSPGKQKRKASIAAVIAEIGIKGYNDLDYSDIKQSLGMKKIYNYGFIISLINIYSKLSWGLLLLRTTSPKGPAHE